MTENVHIGTTSFALLIAGAAIFTAVPVAIAIIWMVKKKEPVTSILIGAAAFLLFVVVLEKPIQNVLAFPTAMGLTDHAVSRFLSANPVLLAFVAGLFPGVFEETGRLIAFKTVLKNRRNSRRILHHPSGICIKTREERSARKYCRDGRQEPEEYRVKGIETNGKKRTEAGAG